MKKIYFVLAVLATAMLSSCLKEPLSNELTPLGENDIAFVLSGVSTKSMASASMKEAGVSLPMGVDSQGNKYFLDETIEELNPNPTTKGAPAYTVNVGTLYTTMGVYAAMGNFADDDETGEATFVAMDLYQHDKNDTSENPVMGWRYRHGYAFNPWPGENTKVDFYLRMPADQVGISSEGYSYDDGKIAFDFTTPFTNNAKDAEVQQDLLFGHTSISKSDHDGYLPNGAPVTMYHALTGIKFRVGNNNSGPTKTVITGVEISGISGTGRCVIDPAAEKKVVWTPGTPSANYKYSQTFANPTYTPDDGASNPDGSISYTSGENNTFGDTWYAAANDKNLNNEAGSWTFWRIPQTVPEDAILKVTFRVKTPDTPDGTEITHTITDFGAKLNNVEWKAGELRTYTLRPTDVDVEIFDTMNHLVKSNLHVTNTGNVDEYVRMMLVGNWYDKDGDILVGYKTDGSGGPDDNEMADPWFRGDSQWNQYFDYDLPAGEERIFVDGIPVASSTKNKWIFGTGSYFYYPDVIGAGSTLDPATQALFKNYILPEDAIPTIYIPSAHSNTRVEAEGVHLVMEVVIQAISTVNPETGKTFEEEAIEAGKPEGSGWMAAWSYALGKNVVPKQTKTD